MASEKVVKTFVAKFKIDTKGLRESFGKIGDSFAGLSKGIKDKLNLKGIFNHLTDTVGKFQNNVLDFALFSERTGLDIKKASQLAGALETMGGSADEARATMESLQQAITDAKFGGGALIDVAKKYGLSLLDENGQLLNTTQLMDNIADRMAKLSKAEQVDFANMLGLGDAGALLFSKGSKNLNKQMSDSLFTVDDKDAKNAMSLQKNIARMQQAGKAIGLELQRGLIPFIEKITTWVAKHLPQIVDYLKDIISQINKLMSKVKPFFNMILGYIRKIDFKNIMGQIHQLPQILNNLLSNISPMLTKLVDVVADLVGDMGTKIKNAIQNMDWQEAQKFMVNYFKTFGSVLGKIIGNIFKGAFNLGKWIVEGIQNINMDDIYNALSYIGNIIKGFFLGLFNNIWEEIKDTGLGKVFDKIGSTTEKIKGLGGKMFNNVKGLFGGKDNESPKQAPQYGNRTTVNNNNNQNNNQKTNTIINNNVTINAKGDNFNNNKLGNNTVKQINRALVQGAGA